MLFRSPRVKITPAVQQIFTLTAQMEDNARAAAARADALLKPRPEGRGFAGRYDQALQWQADVLERLRLSRVHTPVVWALGERMTASSCTDAPCRASDWRDSLLADWYTRLSREMPQVQVWMSPWASDPRLQLIGLRWPEATPSERLLPLNQTCPVGWQCLVGLGWP